MKVSKKLIEVVAAIIKIENKYLCCQRKKNKLTYLSEKYEFPGGKIENNETKEEALKREIKEAYNEWKKMFDSALKYIEY